MSKYNWIDRQNKVHPWNFKKIDDNVYAFRVGSILVGQLFKIGNGNWSVVVDINNPQMIMAEGFRSRHAAANFALKSARMI